MAALIHALALLSGLPASRRFTFATAPRSGIVMTMSVPFQASAQKDRPAAIVGQSMKLVRHRTPRAVDRFYKLPSLSRSPSALTRATVDGKLRREWGEPRREEPLL